MTGVDWTDEGPADDDPIDTLVGDVILDGGDGVGRRPVGDRAGLTGLFVADLSIFDLKKSILDVNLEIFRSTLMIV